MMRSPLMGGVPIRLTAGCMTVSLAVSRTIMRVDESTESRFGAMFVNSYIYLYIYHKYIARAIELVCNSVEEKQSDYSRMCNFCFLLFCCKSVPCDEDRSQGCIPPLFLSSCKHSYIYSDSVRSMCAPMVFSHSRFPH